MRILSPDEAQFSYHASVTFRNDRSAITGRTKMIIVNTPHNPVGKVFTRSELEKIAELANEFNLLVMSDEVVSLCIAPLFGL